MPGEPNDRSVHRNHRSVRARWLEIERRARQDDGVVATGWLVGELGLSRPAVSRAVRDGLLHPVHAGVVATGRTLTDRGRLRAGLLAVGDGGVLGGRAGSAAHGLLRLNALVDVLTPTRRRSHRGVRVREAALDPCDVTGRHRMPVLTVARLLLDCAGEHWIDDLLHEAEVRRVLDLAAVEDVLARHRRRRGAAQLRAALERRGRGRGATRSELERAGRRFLQRHGFPPHERGVLFELTDGRVIERDCFWPQQRVLLEFDGRAVHDTVRAFEKDRADDALLLAQGIVTVRATWARLHAGEAELAGTLWQVLSSRGSHEVHENAA